MYRIFVTYVHSKHLHCVKNVMNLCINILNVWGKVFMACVFDFDLKAIICYMGHPIS